MSTALRNRESGTRRPVRRALTGSLATVMAGAALVALPSAPAQADAASPVLTWRVSQYFDEHLSTHTYTGDVTETPEGVITFPGGVGTFNTGGTSASISYTGSVTGAFVNAGTEYYHVTIADPTVTVDVAGEGQITAVVSASNISTGPTSPAASTEPTRVAVTTFDAPAGWTVADGLGSITATPDWAGVLPADSAEATALGIGAGKPVDGKSFSPAFLGQVTPGVRALFYASGSTTGDPKKNPAVFTAQATPEAAPTTTTTVTGASYTDGLDLSVTGSGFRAVTKPGDAGVYVGLAPSGGLPDVSSQEGMASFAGSNWVMPGGITDGAFTSSIHADTAALDPTKTYSVYTWQAHAHSNTTQDTETPVTIDWSALEKETSTTVASGAASKVYGTTSTITATVSGPGSVTLTGVGAGQTRPVADGKAVFTVPATLAAGSYTAKLAYSGGDALQPSSTTRALKVTKATPAVTRSWTRKPVSTKAGRLKVTVKGAAGVLKPSGKVTLVLKKGAAKKTVTGTLANGVVTITVPKLAKGTWTPRLTYAGAANYTSRTVTLVALKIKK